MTGRQKIEAAFSEDGTPEIPAVICYEGIYVRDHWDQLTDCPWWYIYSLDIEEQVAWQRDVIERTGQDWFWLPAFVSRDERASTALEERPDGVFRIDRCTGREERLVRPQVGGWSPGGQLQSIRPARPAASPEEIDRMLPLPDESDLAAFRSDGRADLAGVLLREFGEQLFPFCHVASPLWGCYGLWGFEGMMTMVAERPDLVEHACRRVLARSKQGVRMAAALGAAGIWIEECMTDMVSPAAFASLNVPFVREVVEEIRSAGMRSIYYYCGNPAGKWDLIFSVGADAVSLEESKKGFTIDIEEVVDRAGGRCAVLGNLDAIVLLAHGSRGALRAEISRQIAAGRRNRSRFITSLGSPVTPPTTVGRVRLYCDLVHGLGAP